MIADTMPSLLEQIDRALSDGRLRADAAENIRRILSGEESDFAARVIGELSQGNQWEELNDRFYKMMQSSGAGDKVSKIELVDLTPEDVKKAAAPQDSPTGGKVCLNLKPTKKLVIVIEKKDENGSSTNTTENFIAEKDGKFVIPVPGPCK